MTQEDQVAVSYHHHKKIMRGRNPHEANRVATSLELLFDLTFVICFGFAASHFSHAMAEGHFQAGLMGFAMTSYAIGLAWSNFSWFASAYDTDDWVYRVTTMVQMIGVLVFSMGLPDLFNKMEGGSTELNNAIMVGGYVIMRIAMIFQWLRAAHEDPHRRATCITHAVTILVAQIGWVLRVAIDMPFVISMLTFFILAIIEFSGSYLAERKHTGIPWHAHHIAERYSLFAIIALGEGVVGTVAALSAVIERQGWTMDTVLVGLAGVGLTFTLWWTYFLLPSGQAIHKNRNKVIAWAFFQMILIISIVAIGAALHAAAYFLEGKSHISSLTTVSIVAVPVGVFLGAGYFLYYYLTESCDRFHFWLLLATGIVFLLAIIAAAMGANMALCLILLTCAPTVTVVGYELYGHRLHAKALAKIE